MLIRTRGSPRTDVRRRRDRRPDLSAVLDRPRFEVLPVPGIEDEVAASVPAHATVTVTASRRRGIHTTLDIATRLAERGTYAVPHLAARLIADESELKQIISDLATARIPEVFVIGGDADTPVGDFSGSLELLQAMHAIGHDFTIGIAGYPEPHPKISDDLAVQAMWDKRVFASYIVSQMCFEPRTLLNWVSRVRQRGIMVPIYAGVAGPASTTRLLRISRRIGVGESARMLSKNTGLLRLARPGHWRPDALIKDLAPALSDREYGLAGLHLYTFNAVRETEEWRQDARRRLS